MDRFEKQYRELLKAYKIASEISGFSLEELYDKCLVLITDRNSKYYREIGIVDYNFSKNDKETYVVKLRLNPNKKPRKVRFEREMSNLTNKLSSSLNVEVLLEERKSLPSLLPD